MGLRDLRVEFAGNQHPSKLICATHIELSTGVPNMGPHRRLRPLQPHGNLRERQSVTKGA
jgi:hypothetical protein